MERLLSFCFITLLIITSGCTTETTQVIETTQEINSDDGSVKLSVPEKALSQGISIDELSITKIQDVEISIEDSVIIGYKLEPDGMEFDEPVLLEFELETPEENETDIPLLFHMSGDEIEILNMTYVVEENSSRILANLTHFSSVYYIPPTYHWKREHVSRSFYKISQSVPSKLVVGVSEDFTVGITYKKLLDSVVIKRKDGSYYEFKKREGYDKVSGHFWTGYREYSDGFVKITPIEKDAPPKSKFAGDTYKVTEKFRCVSPGSQALVYYAHLEWQNEIGEGKSSAKHRFNGATRKFYWNVKCVDIEVSCAEHDYRGPGDGTITVGFCKDDCPENKYCYTTTCVCKDKKVLYCSKEEKDVEIFGPTPVEERICKDDCPDKTKCNMNTCQCESTVPEYSCKNRTDGDYPLLTGDYMCKDDCDLGWYCDQNTCQCIPQSEIDETKSKKGEVDIVVDDAISAYEKKVCTPDPFEYGEINVVEKSGTGDWEVSGDGYEAGLLNIKWQIKHTNPQQTASGIIINFKVIGPEGNTTDWERTNEKGIMESTYPVYVKGTYTVEIVDFDTFGKYCGEGDKIVIDIK